MTGYYESDSSHQRNLSKETEPKKEWNVNSAIENYKDWK